MNTKKQLVYLLKHHNHKSVDVGGRLGVDCVEERDKSKLLGVTFEYTDVVSEPSVSDDE